MTRQKIKKIGSNFLVSRQLPVPAPRALSGQNPRGSGPQKPYLAGWDFLRPHWWPGAGHRVAPHHRGGAWTWGSPFQLWPWPGASIPLCCSAGAAHAPPAPLLQARARVQHGKQLWGYSQPPRGSRTHTHAFRALQFGILALQQALTSIYLPGFVEN